MDAVMTGISSIQIKLKPYLFKTDRIEHNKN